MGENSNSACYAKYVAKDAAISIFRLFYPIFTLRQPVKRTSQRYKYGRVAALHFVKPEDAANEFATNTTGARLRLRAQPIAEPPGQPVRPPRPYMAIKGIGTGRKACAAFASVAAAVPTWHSSFHLVSMKNQLKSLLGISMLAFTFACGSQQPAEAQNPPTRSTAGFAPANLSGLAMATFAGGCFWAQEEAFEQLKA